MFRVLRHFVHKSILPSLISLVIVDVLLAYPSSIQSFHQGDFLERATTQASAQAVILFIGDGMGEAHRTAARWSTVGQAGTLAMDAMPFNGWAHTASADSAVTDSAAAATALAAGVKTNNGMIGQDPGGDSLTTILERAKARGMAVGLVTSTQMAHATPAAFAAHVPKRYMMTDIADQMLAVGVEVLLGGGEDEFLPTAETGCYPESGERTDGRNLITEAIAAGYTYVCDAAAFATVNPATTNRLLGLFADEGMTRPYAPSLTEMTQMAIDILSQDPDGFFLMVEGGQIDWASHANDAANTIADTVGFDQAVAVAQNHASTTGDVLIVVTADHETGGMSAVLTSSGSPGEDGPFYMPDGTPFYVNWTTGSHTAADVPTTAQGPSSNLLAGSYENTYIHEVMRTALDLWLQTWDGSESTDWHNADNWTPRGVPRISEDVSIPSLPPNQPIVGSGNAGECTDLTVEEGASLTLLDETSSLTASGTVANNGTLRQTKPVGNEATVDFVQIGADKYLGVRITDESGNGLGNTTIAVMGNQLCPATTELGGPPVERCFVINPQNQNSATIRFYYLSSELNGNDASTLNVYHLEADELWNWNLQEGTYTREADGGDYNWVQVTGVDEYSFFTLSARMPGAPAKLYRVFLAIIKN